MLLMTDKWIAFSYTLAAKKKSSTRVTLWRRLQRLGAISPVSGVHLLPATDRCVESFQWLAQEVKQAGGQVIVMRVAQFEGLEDQVIVELFQAARQSDYAAVDEELSALELALKEDGGVEAVGRAQDLLAKLKRRHSEIVAIDYFDNYEQATTAARLDKLSQQLFPELNQTPTIPLEKIADYQGKTWVTRPQPHVDRLASIWLIRRFIDESATVRYSPTVSTAEIGFDMSDPQAKFGHNGSLCTFETMIKAFQIEAKGIESMAEIIHQIDLDDERFVHPEAIGIDAVLRGWLLQKLTDQELETRGVALFDGIYQILAAR